MKVDKDKLIDEATDLLLHIRKRLKRSRMADAPRLIKEIEQFTQKTVNAYQTAAKS